jgi:hypothetical protein
MATHKPTNNDILTQLQIDLTDTNGNLRNLEAKVVNIDKKIDTGFENLKGYVPAEIYKLHMEAQKIVNDNHETRIKALEQYVESNGSGIKFSNDIVKNILKTVGGLAGAALIIGAATVLLKNGGGI